MRSLAVKGCKTAGRLLSMHLIAARVVHELWNWCTPHQRSQTVRTAEACLSAVLSHDLATAVPVFAKSLLMASVE